MLKGFLQRQPALQTPRILSKSVLGRPRLLAGQRHDQVKRPRASGMPTYAARTESQQAAEKGKGQNANSRDTTSRLQSELGASQMSTLQPKPAAVQLDGGRLLADGGFPILDHISPLVTTRALEGKAKAQILSVSVDKASSSFEFKLGHLRCTRFLACARIKLWWMAPEWGRKASELPPETQFLLLELGTGAPYAVILPLIDSGRFRCTLRPPRKGGDAETALRLRIESGDEAVQSNNWSSAVLVASGYDPFSLVGAAVEAAAKLSGGAKPQVDKVMPDFVNYFGWCTWDAFYSTVSAEGLQQGLRSFAEGNVAPKFLIIDDGWQQTGADAADLGTDTERLEAKKEMLRTVGAGGHYPVNRLQSEGEGPPQRSLVTGLAQRLLGRVQALAETSLLVLYKAFVENAPEESWRISFFTSLAKGPLRPMLLSYYALTSDHTQRLQGVKANGKFSGINATPDTPMTKPEDLKSIVTDAKDRFGVKYVYAWHSLHGYWAGVATGNSNAMPYDGQLVMPNPTPGTLEIDPCFGWAQQVISGVGVAKDVRMLYSDMHIYLKGAGIDGVKVDCQAILGMVGGGSPGLGGGPAMSAEYHSALEASVERHFPGNNCINCMCHSTEDIYRMESTAIARSSDDFWPRDPASHTTHVGINAFNSLFMSPVVQPDWDMFHSRHPAALLHATARVVSGGPLYVSDKPGHHDFALLKRLVLPDGTLLRCRQAGLPTLDCLFSDVMRDAKSALKVWNVNSSGGVVAAFNLQGAAWSRQARKYTTHDLNPASLSTVVSPGDVPSYKGQDRTFAVYSDSLKRLWHLTSWEGVHLGLSPGQSDIFTIFPVGRQPAKGSADVTEVILFAPIGLVNMLNSGGAISNWDPSNQSRSSQFGFKVKGAGELLAFCSKRPQRLLLDGQPVDFEYSADDSSLRCLLPAPSSNVAVQF